MNSAYCSHCDMWTPHDGETCRTCGGYTVKES